MSVHTET